MTVPVLSTDGEEQEPGLAPKDSGVEPASRPKLVSRDKMGPLLDEPDESKVFKMVEKEWKKTERQARNRIERTKRNIWWRQGKRFARLEDKIEDKGLIKATLPPGMSSMPPMPNKVDDLCRKIVAQATVDPPQPEVEPETDSDEDRGAAEFATRFLKADGAESGTNDAEIFRQALDHGTTAGSGYIHLWVDPNGNGWRPQEIKAHPLATDVNNPLEAPPQIGPDGQPVPVEPADYITRYVKGSEITDNPGEADRQWLPKIKADLVPMARVRLVPETASSAADADGVLLLLFDTLGELRARYESDDEPWGEDFLDELCAWRPTNLQKLVAPALYRSIIERDNDSKDKDKGPNDDTIVFYYLRYNRSTKQYPEGCIVAVNGGGEGHVLIKEPWSAEIEVGEKGTKTDCLEVPVIQVKQEDDVDGDPNGMGVIEKFGAADEQRAMVLSAWNEFLDIHLHPNLFVTATSPVQPKQLSLRDGTPITVLSKEDMPMYEDERSFPADGVRFLELITHDMDTASGLQETAQGGENPNSQSGVAKRIVVEQSQVALGGLFQNFTAAMKRFWRIKLQLARAKMTVPQLVQYVGDDGGYKQEYWTGADFTGTRDVGIKRGSGTMMSASQKQQWIMGMITPSVPGAPTILDLDEARDLIRSGIQGEIGIEDDPHLMRVRRQIAEFGEGPPDNFQPAKSSVDPATGQPVQQAASFTPFDPRANDEEPAVAKVRHRELTRVMAGSQYSKWPEGWRGVFDVEYKRMAYAAGIQTVREQQQMQQQQAQQQQQMQQQQIQAQQQQQAQQAQEHQMVAEAKVQELQQRAASHSQDLAHAEQSHQMQLGQQAASASQDIAIARMKAMQQAEAAKQVAKNKPSGN